MKLYLVRQTDGWDENIIIGTFLNKDKAEKMIQLEQDLQEDDYYSFYIDEQETMDDKIQLDSKVVPYFSYTCDVSEHDLPIEECEHVLDELGLTRQQFDEKDEQYQKLILQELSHPDHQFCNDCMETTRRIYDKDLYIDENCSTVTVYSINSYEEARNKALELWSKNESK